MIFAAGASATPAAMGSISSEQDEAQRSTTGNCLNVPDGYCAVLYDDENCAGWSFNVPTGTYDLPWRYRHGCQMAIAGLLDHMCLALRASGLWLRYATLQNWIPSFPWIAPGGWRVWGRNELLPSGNLGERGMAHQRKKFV